MILRRNRRCYLRSCCFVGARRISSTGPARVLDFCQYSADFHVHQTGKANTAQFLLELSAYFRRARKALLPLLALLSAAYTPISADAEPLKILMIGNSYTDETRSGLRGFLKADADLAASTVTKIGSGGDSLFRHFTRPRTLEALTDTDWDAVILQDQGAGPAIANLQPDPPPDISKTGDTSLYHNFWIGGRGLSDALTTANPNVDLVFFSTWARHDDEDMLLPTYFSDSPRVMQDHTNASYAALSSEYSGSRVAPVGEAWLESYKQRSDFRLHASDSAHGNSRGYYLAGAVLYEVVSGRSSVGSNYTAQLSGEDARYLQEIATATTQVPEPSCLVLAGISIAGMLGYARQRSRGSRPPPPTRNPR